MTVAGPAGAPRMRGRALLTVARHDLSRAAALEPAERYRVALSVAVRAAAAVLADRARPAPDRRGPQAVWSLLAARAPRLREWADFFALMASRPVGIGHRPITEREADDLVRDAGRFLDEVTVTLGTPPGAD